VTQPSDPNQSDSPTSAEPNHRQPEVRAALARYWRSNIKIMISLLVVWAVAGLGCGVLFAKPLNAFSIGGYPLGFWFAQQGSIVVFVFIILIYCCLLNRLDRKHHEELERLRFENKGREGKA
jgi:putative solute:sodium symporter small subunit